MKKFEAQIAEHIEVLECYHLAGVYDYLLKLAVRDMQEYQLFMMEKLAVMDNVGNVQTSFALNTLVERAIEGREWKEEFFKSEEEKTPQSHIAASQGRFRT